MKQRMGVLAYCLLAVIFSCMIMGMSGGGTGSMGAQSNAFISFDAKLTDIDSNSVQLSSAIIDGKTAFQASMGKGRVTIPFEQISRIEVKGKNACVILKDSKKVCNLVIRESSKLSGNTSFGFYQIPLNDVVWIEITRAR
jgi:hypothetical protein